MKLHSWKVSRFVLPLRSPFTTHAGALQEREGILVEIRDSDGVTGYGECVAFAEPFYTAETVETAWEMLTVRLLPRVMTASIQHPREIPVLFKGIIGHQMAKAAAEAAVWDLYAKRKQKSLSEIIGGVRAEVAAGAVLNLSDNIAEAAAFLKEAGYKRVKLKVHKGFERQQLEQVKQLAPDLPLMFDGNGAYGAEDLDHLAALEDLELLMIEQPFPTGDFVLHSWLQQQTNTPVCLDESIESYHDAWQAIELKACQVMNIKIGRVGGLTEALRIHELCREHDIKLWCGGMVETGISKAHNLALASLPQFSVPGDLSASGRYFDRDIISSDIQVKAGRMVVPSEPGIGVDIDRAYLTSITVHTAVS